MTPPSTRKYWIAVASADHARRGRDEMVPGFMQVCHGKQAPLKRLRAGDWVTYYAPTVTMGGPQKCQSFISLGVVRDHDVYPFDMGGFVPYRRDLDYVPTHETPIAPLLPALEWVDGAKNWGYKLRFGLLAISEPDMLCIAKAMQADLAMLNALTTQHAHQDCALATAPVAKPAPNPAQSPAQFALGF